MCSPKQLLCLTSVIKIKFTNYAYFSADCPLSNIITTSGCTLLMLCRVCKYLHGAKTMHLCISQLEHPDMRPYIIRTIESSGEVVSERKTIDLFVLTYVSLYFSTFEILIKFK